MAQPYVGEIRMFAGNFAPAGWMFCSGQQLPISEYDALFQLLGTTYGGDGESTFDLPNLQGRVPIHMGTGTAGTTYQLAETGGVETVTLTANQTPVHNHAMIASGDVGSTPQPANNVLAQNTSVTLFRVQAPALNLNAQAVGTAGGSQPHENLQPYLCVDFIISLFGIFPSPT
jgi:microcystin-dependent protein